MPVYYKGKNFDTCKEGYLADYRQYCPEWKEHAARSLHITSLSKVQNQIIDLVRDYYIERGEAPMIRYLAKSAGLNPSDIMKEFPGGIASAAKLAGIPKPTNKK